MQGNAKGRSRQCIRLRLYCGRGSTVFGGPRHRILQPHRRKIPPEHGRLSRLGRSFGRGIGRWLGCCQYILLDPSEDNVWRPTLQ